ncbi:helix-turn-helix domain-containing protein [Candidatus Daviesbacteria bacterium]|nr:helix-turn-helix domain-containing protein [Candidatus Daviesbacteria bacterium]
MKTVGQILKETRESKLLTLEEVEKHTKIRKELLEALEASDFSKLPPSTFIQGFIKNYSKFLNLNADKLLAVYRRDFEAKKHPPIILDSFANPLNSPKFRLTPSRVLGTIVALVILGFFVYLWVEYRQFIGAPNLEVDSPKDQQSIDIPSVVVEGKTEPEVKVMVNNQEVGVDQSGHFRAEIKLSSSVNTVIITATGKFGQSAKIERTVILKK